MVGSTEASVAGGDLPEDLGLGATRPPSVAASAVTAVAAAEPAADGRTDDSLLQRLSAVPYYEDNPFPRPFNAPLLPALYSLRFDPSYVELERQDAVIAALREAEVGICAQSYLYDLEQLLRAESVGYLADYVHAVGDLLNGRLSELYVRAAHAANEPLLEAVERQRRGVAPGVSLNTSCADILRRVNDVAISQAIARGGRGGAAAPASFRGGRSGGRGGRSGGRVGGRTGGVAGAGRHAPA